jgi:hypothetical protein
MQKNKQSNENIQSYLQELEKEYGINKIDPNESINKKNYNYLRLYNLRLYNGTPSGPNFRSKYEWPIKMRLKYAWQMFKSYRTHLSKYNPFDFKSYKEEYNPYGFDIYTKIYKTSTPWTRLKRFLQEIKNMFRYTKKAFFHTPSDIKHYQKNKKRITWFENNIWGWFFGSKKEKENHKQKLQDLGYILSEDGNSVEYKTINK